MKMVKSLLLGSAAGLVAIAGAQAADLPVKAKPVQYVKICSLYGAGFYYIPGTDTCMKLGGWVRVEIGLNGGNSGAVFNNGAGGRDTRVDDSYASMRSRFVITTDTRTQTEYGTLRTYTRAGMQASYQDYNQGGTYFERAFIQLGGFTFGKTQSFFDFMGGAFSYSGYYGGYSNTGAGGTNLFAYTASFGNGLSATISAEDPTIRYGVVYDTGAGAAAQALGIGTVPGPFSLTSSSYPGGGAAAIGNQRAQVPDLVANFRVDQAWGSAQIMGALHQLRAGFYTNNPLLGSPGDAWAYAVGGGVSVNLPWAKGDKAFVEATYTNGAMCYVGLCQNGTQMAYDRWTSSSLGVAWALDSVFGGAGTSQQLTTAWAITGGIEHYWKPNVRTSLYGAYTQINYNNTAKALMGASSGANLTIAGFNPDFAVWAVGSKTVWNPAAGLDVGLEVLYTDLHTNNTGPIVVAANNGGRPAGVYTSQRDAGVLQGLFRIQRNFWP